jgi:hypothetical protein
MRRGGTFVLASLAALLLGTGVASAATATFGANLARAPDNPVTCVGLQLLPSSETCTVVSTNLVTGESVFPPVGEGIVSNVRVRVGTRTGPMQIVLEEALRKDNPVEPGRPTYACCSLLAASPIFTPAANGITTVPVNFRVKQSLTPEPSGFYVDQHLALSVLDPTVPIPAGLDPNAILGAWFPAWAVIGEQRVGPSGTFVAADLLINADWDPLPGAGSAPAGLQLPRQIRPVRDNLALLPLFCRLSRACVGRVLLQNRRLAAAARVNAFSGVGAERKGKKGKGRTVTYASAKFRIPAGKRKTIRARLLEAGRRLLKRHKKAKVWLNAQMSGADTESVQLTLRRGSSKNQSKK